MSTHDLNETNQDKNIGKLNGSHCESVKAPLKMNTCTYFEEITNH